MVATADGAVQTFVIAGEVTPTWAEQAPACITQGTRLKAIRSEVDIPDCFVWGLFHYFRLSGSRKDLSIIAIIDQACWLAGSF